MRPATSTHARAILLGSLAVACLGCGENRATDARPNVLLITVDTLRADYLSSYGFAFETSPNIDALAREGVVFERAIAGASATTPSHASIMTSKYTRQHSVGWHNGDSKLQGTSTLAEIFRWEGYATAAFVSNFMLRTGLGFEQGFDLYDDELTVPELNRPKIFERIAEQTTRRALDWLEGLDGGPFFLWVHYQDPHGPYAPPPGFEDRFQLPPGPDEKALPVLDDLDGYNGIPDYQALEGLNLPSQYKSRYADEIFYADQWLGKLLAAVDSHERDAIVLFTSDHGESMGEHERYFVHGYTTTPGEAHVPMILRAPGIAAGRRSASVSHVDVMPTLLELAGLDPAGTESGLALGPFLRAQQPIPERLVYCDIGFEVSAYSRDGFVRYIKAGGDGAQNPRWVSYAWQPGGASSAVALDDTQRQTIETYLSKVTPIVKLPRLGQEDLEKLRALGYVGH